MTTIYTYCSLLEQDFPSLELLLENPSESDVLFESMDLHSVRRAVPPVLLICEGSEILHLKKAYAWVSPISKESCGFLRSGWNGGRTRYCLDSLLP